MTASSPEPFPPDEIPLAEARAILGDLADAAAEGRVIYLTRRGRRIAAIVPADEKMATNPSALEFLDQFIAKHDKLFDRLADA